MATTTPNYGWPVPTSTDLVKDGAVAIESLGDAADATMATMVPKSIVDAKGDIIAATAADTVSRLAVGANDTVLTADSTAATGLKWATPASGFVGVSLTKSAAQSIPNATETVITFDTEVFDTNGFHTSTDGKITVPSGKAGKYLITAQIMSNSSGSTTQGGMRKNGSGVFTYYISGASPLTAPCVLINTVVSLAVADYLEIFVYQGSGVAKDVLANSYTPSATVFSATYLGA